MFNRQSKKQKASLNSSPSSSSSSSSPSKSSSTNHSSSEDRNDENTQNHSVPASPPRRKKPGVSVPLSPHHESTSSDSISSRQGSTCHPSAPEVRPASTTDNEQLEALSEPGTVNADHNADPCGDGKPTLPLPMTPMPLVLPPSTNPPRLPRRMPTHHPLCRQVYLYLTCSMTFNSQWLS